MGQCPADHGVPDGDHLMGMGEMGEAVNEGDLGKP